MDDRIEKLIKEFEENGWTAAGLVEVSSDWWFQDIFLMTSHWHPVGIKLYFTLLTDPGILNKKVIWCVGISVGIPEKRHFKYTDQITLNDISKENLKAFVSRINDIVLR